MFKFIVLCFILLISSCDDNSNPLIQDPDSPVITINNYGTGAACGGSVLIHNADVMRSFNGGLARMDNELNLEEVSIGDFQQWQIYHVEKIDGKFWFAITDFQDLNEAHVLDDNGEIIEIYEVGQTPGDFAKWSNGNISWVFVANEGNYGASNGSISMIDNNGNVYETDAIGDVVQSLNVYGDKLIVLINNSHKIKIYDITSQGLAMPGIEVSTNGSSPREMTIIDGRGYFTNWNTSDVKVFNLYTYNIDESISVGVMPEGIITDGETLWIANSGEDTVYEIDISSRLVNAIYNVGQGPQNLIINDGAIYTSRTYYSADWTETYHGASKIHRSIND